MTVRKNERRCERIKELSRTETYASLLHNVPLQETQFPEDFFLHFQPANRVVSGSGKPKLANYTKIFLQFTFDSSRD